MAPEIILGATYDDAVDIWSLGIMIYEMLTGKTPFYSKQKKLIFNKILTEHPDLEHENLSRLSADLIRLLLNKNMNARIKIEDIFRHPFFNGVDFDKLLKKEVSAPIIPCVVY